MATTLHTKWRKYGPFNDARENARVHLTRFNYVFRGHSIYPPLGFEAGKEEVSAILYLIREEGFQYLGTPEALPTDRLGENMQRPLPGEIPASRS